MVGAALEIRTSMQGSSPTISTSPETLRAALRNKGPKRLMLVTDAMPSVSSDETSVLIHGAEIHRNGDRLLGADNTAGESRHSPWPGQ